MNRFILSTLAFLLLSFGQALDAKAFEQSGFLKQFEDLAERRGEKFSYGSVNTEGNNLIVEDIRYEDASGERELNAGSTIFLDVRVDGERFLFEGIEMTGVEYESENAGKVLVGTISANGLEFPSATDPAQFLKSVDEIVATNITVLPEGSAENGSFTIPQMVMSGYSNEGNQANRIQRISVDAFTGRVFNEETGSPVDMTFKGSTIENFRQFGEIGFDIGLVDIGAFNLNTTTEGGPTAISFGGARLENYYSWDPTVPDAPLIPDNDITVAVGPMSVEIAGKPVFSWAGMDAQSENDAENKTSKSEGNIREISIDFTALPETGSNERNLQNVKELGYEKLTADISMNGFLDLKSGDLDISEFKLDAADAGSINLTVNIDGYTEDLARKVAATAATLRSATDAQQTQANSMQMLAALAPLSIAAMQIDITDNTLLDRIVSLQARRINQDPAQVSGMVAPMAGIMLAPFQIPEFAASVSGALGIFMQGNRTISARIEPPNGLAITEMIALGSAVRSQAIEPQAVIERLNLTVTAK